MIAEVSPSPLNVIASAARQFADQVVADKDRRHPLFCSGSAMMVGFDPGGPATSSRQIVDGTGAPVSTRRVYCMKRLMSDDTEVLCWADVPANATCMELEAIDTPDGDAAPVIAIDYEERVFERDDGLGPRAWPAATYEQDDLRWTPSTGGPHELDDKVDGVMLRELLEVDDDIRREVIDRRPVWFMITDGFTPAQRAAISAHWSAELRRKVEASADRERCRVLVDVEVDHG